MDISKIEYSSLNFVRNDIASQLQDSYMGYENCIREIALICKHAKYPEDLEDIYDVLEKYGVNYKEIRE